MTYDAKTVDEYIRAIPEERKMPFSKLRETILSSLPEGFEETISYSLPSYVVPHSLYPAGYHCKPEEPLPFISIASQKHFVGVYHMGIYADPDLMSWFQDEYAKLDIGKLDMGKSCIRLKKINDIPFDLIGQLASKMSVDEWITIYEQKIKR